MGGDVCSQEAVLALNRAVTWTRGGQVTLFQYAGELRKTDQLVKLKTRVEQSELPRTVLDAVWVSESSGA